MAESPRGWIREALDRVIGSDPGLNRLRMAVSAAVAMASTLGIEYLFARATHAGPQGTVVAMLLGTVMAMMGSMALSGTGVLDKVRTAAFFPVAIGAGMLCGVAVAGRTDLMLSVFVVVMFVAVYVRRFGAAFFFYGFMIWMGYFFAAFLGATLSALPSLLYAVLVATAWVLLLSVTVLRVNSRRTLRRTQLAFGARARSVARACAALLETGAHDRGSAAARRRRLARARRRLHARQLRLAEAALIIEGWSAEPGALPEGWSGPALRRRLLDAHLAVDTLATAADALTTAGGELVPVAARVAGHLARREYGAVEYAARPLLEAAPDDAGGTDFPADGDGRWPARHLAASALEFVALARDAVTPPPTDPVDDYAPAVTLAMGNLPGSAAVAGDVAARGSRWNPLSRMSLTTRQAIQVVVAGTLAILAGRELSQTRYYWAVLAAFIAFAGTSTRSETSIKAVNRVVGTLVGLGAGIGLAHLTAGHTLWVLVVIVASMSCGFYLVNVSYACMIFFVTIMVSQLYSVLHEFSAGLLVLRLEETSLGAAIGIGVALFVLPTSTRDTVATARGRYFTALAELLRAVTERLEGARSDEELDALARVVDHRLQQLALVARPLTRPMLLWGNSPAVVRHRLTLYAAVTRQTRALTVGPRRLADLGPAAAHGRAEVCRELALAAEKIAGRPLPRHGRASEEADRLLASVEAALLSSGPDCDAAGHSPVTQPLLRLTRLVHELAGAPGTLNTRQQQPADIPARPATTPTRVPVTSAAVTAVPGPATTTTASAMNASATTALMSATAPVSAAPAHDSVIRGRVTDDAGAPLARAALAVTDLGGRQRGRTVARTDGRFTLDVPGPGTYLLIGSADGRAPLARTVRVGAAGVDVDLSLDADGPRGVRVSGTVRTPAGTPCAGARLTLLDGTGEVLATTVAARDGHYAFTDVAPGDYTVVAAGHAPAATAVRLAPGAAERFDPLLGGPRP
ncbi:carboxypeptidase regulatory-like domain-containing protein [Streptantibioticus parmotrematis]|uniref:carboxypeptidase regulatory-like domain-containing protein n=1 Tax=Streptantibioticus parmotrematis TaxID=2873249 RepID=UPI00340F6D18